MIQPKTQTREYWENSFTLTSADIDQIYTFFLETESPQPTSQLAKAVMSYRIAEEQNDLLRRLSGRTIYQPHAAYTPGDELVFPALNYAYGQVTGVRQGHNPEHGDFKVVSVTVNGKTRHFAAELQTPHALNNVGVNVRDLIETVSVDDVFAHYGKIVEEKITPPLLARDEFVQLGGEWLIKPLLAEVNIGHLHLAEAVLEMSNGGPLKIEEILVHLDLDPGLNERTLRFSLNYALLKDERFDEVAPKGQVAWFLRRLEPARVQVCAEPLAYKPIAYDRALLAPNLLTLERELADEWSDLEALSIPTSLEVSLIYPHRRIGTLPLNNRLRKMLPLGRSPRQRITFRDAQTHELIPVWMVEAFRYLYGLWDWYEANGIPVGGKIIVQTSDNPNEFILDFDRRRPQREDVRLASVEDGRLKFALDRRRIGCGYDDLLIVDTDFAAAVEGLRARYHTQQRSLASLVADLLPELARLSLQGAVHAKTLYSAINMVRRTPPGPLFAELVRHPAFQSVGDHYWRFDQRRWQG